MIANIVLWLITRFVQFIGVIAVLSGISLAEPLFEYLIAMRAGEPWVIGELGLRFVKVAGPVYFGGFMVVGMQLFWRILRMLERREKQFPREPWRWNPQWDTNRIRLNNRALFGVLAFFWGLYVLIMLPAGVYMASIKLKAAIYTFVGVFGLILFVISKTTWRNRRWNRSELIMGTMPGVIGGPFRAVAVLPEVFPPDSQFRVQLKCIRKETFSSKGGNTSRTNTETLWQTEAIIGRQIDAETHGTTAIPISFAIPFDCQPSDFKPGGGRGRRVSIDWVLVVKLRSETDLREAAFPVPVYRTSESSPDFRLDDEAIKPYLVKTDVEAILDRMGMRREQRIDGSEQFSFGMRTPGVLRGVVFLVTICIAAIVASFVWLASPVVYFAALLPAVMLLASVWGLFEILCWKSTMTIGPHEVTVECGYTGLTVHNISVQPDVRQSR